MRYGRILFDIKQEVPEEHTVNMRIFTDTLNDFQLFSMFSDGVEVPMIPPPGQMSLESSFAKDTLGNTILPPPGKVRFRVDPQSRQVFAIDSTGDEFSVFGGNNSGEPGAGSLGLIDVQNNLYDFLPQPVWPALPDDYSKVYPFFGWDQKLYVRDADGLNRLIGPSAVAPMNPNLPPRAQNNGEVALWVNYENKLYGTDRYGTTIEVSAAGSSTGGSTGGTYTAGAAGSQYNVQFNNGFTGGGYIFGAHSDFNWVGRSLIVGGQPTPFRETVNDTAFLDTTRLNNNVILSSQIVEGITLTNSFIGGIDNRVGGHSLIVTGSANKVQTFNDPRYGSGAVIGSENIYTGTNTWGNLLVGSQNTMAGNAQSILGGAGNSVSGLNHSLVVGHLNTVNHNYGGDHSVVIGKSNTAAMYNSHIIGGNSNSFSEQAFSNRSYNDDYGVYAVATNGNTITSWNTTIIGGRNNQALNTEYHLFPSYMIATQGNIMNGAGFILGGQDNVVNAYGRAQMVGCNNTIFTNNATFSVAVGLNNKTVDVPNTTCMTRMETFAPGHGWVGRSPNGTRWLARFTDAGTLEVVAA